MEACTQSRKIYIVDGDPDLSLSTKCLLESKNSLVELFDDASQFLNTTFWKKTDTVMIDLDPKKPSVFRLLNGLLSSPKRPNIIVTSLANSALKPNDVFPGERIKILFHPIAPEELMMAVERTA